MVEELDESVAQILRTLGEEKLAESTLVVFTSDNGPWLSQRLSGGSAGLFREGKGTTWEGGLRVPCLAWWPGTIARGRVVQDLASELDLFATPRAGRRQAPHRSSLRQPFARPTASRHGPGSRSEVFDYYDNEVTAVRQGVWKMHVKTIEAASGKTTAQVQSPPLLFNLARDPSERFNVAAEHLDVVRQLTRLIETHRAETSRWNTPALIKPALSGTPCPHSYLFMLSCLQVAVAVLFLLLEVVQFLDESVHLVFQIAEPAVEPGIHRTGAAWTHHSGPHHSGPSQPRPAHAAGEGAAEPETRSQTSRTWDGAGLPGAGAGPVDLQARWPKGVAGVEQVASPGWLASPDWLAPHACLGLRSEIVVPGGA